MSCFVKIATMDVYLETNYLPNISYFSQIIKYENVWIEACEHYQKQSYRNRCYILTSQGKEALICPIEHSQNKMPIQDVKLESGYDWQKKHWRSIETAYRKAPYFEYFADYFENIYTKKKTFLFDFNQELLSICLKLLQVKTNIQLTTMFEKEVPFGHFDMRGEIHPKKATQNVQTAYRQNFGNEFVPDLSIIDLLMCQGTRAKQFLSANSEIVDSGITE